MVQILNQHHFPLGEVFQPNLVADGRFPFDCSFTIQPGLPVFTGPGIYYISLDGNIVYVGKYRPIGVANLLEDRWSRHVQTITCRGYRVTIRQGVLDAFLEAHDPDEGLAGTLNAHPNLGNHNGDMGAVLSRNRLWFVSNNWFAFSGNYEAILDHLGIGYYEIDFAGEDQQLSNQRVHWLETNRLIRSCNPPCNREYRVNLAIIVSTDQFDALVNGYVNELNYLIDRNLPLV